MNSFEKLAKIRVVLDQYEATIDEAHENDCEVTLGGNGINASEAWLLFNPLSKELREILDS